MWVYHAARYIWERNPRIRSPTFGQAKLIEALLLATEEEAKSADDTT